MAHFAKLDDNNVVIRVEVVDNAVLLDSNGIEQEQLGIDFLNTVYNTNRKWVQTSYNHSFRNKYAATGDVYLPEADVFIGAKLYPSWILDLPNLAWKAPKPYPDSPNGEVWMWNEQTLNWEFSHFEQPTTEVVE